MMDYIDHLLRSGKKKTAWSKACNQLKANPIGTKCEGLLLYLLPLTMHYGHPEKMSQFIRLYKKRLNDHRGITKVNRSFLNALNVIFTSLTDRHNLKKIGQQIKSVDWSHLNNQSILQTFRFNIENLRGNRKEAKMAIVSAIRSSSTHYEKALIASALSWQEARKNRLNNSRSIAERSLGIIKDEVSLRSTLLKAQLLGHIGKISQKLGDISTAKTQFSQMANVLVKCRSSYPAQKYIGSLISRESNAITPSVARHLISKQIRALSIKWPYQKSMMIHALFALNELAIKCRNFEESKFALRSIRRLLPINNQEKLLGYYYRDIAKLTIYEEKYDLSCAERFLDEADLIFAKLGTDGWHGTTTSLLIRGELLLHEKEYSRVLNCIKKSQALAELLRNQKLYSYSILLTSFLLLDNKVENKAALYEDVLCKLHTMNNPTLLFRVLSNLYLYSWSSSRLDKSYQIIRSIRSLQPILPARTYRKLWKKYISDIVFSKFRDDSESSLFRPTHLC